MLLCAASLYPDPKIYLGFTMCMIKDYGDIPQRGLIEDCALEHAIDFEKLDDCASKDDGGFGVGMLRDSIRRTSKVGMLLKYCIGENSLTRWSLGWRHPQLYSPSERGDLLHPRRRKMEGLPTWPRG